MRIVLESETRNAKYKNDWSFDRPSPTLIALTRPSLGSLPPSLSIERLLPRTTNEWKSERANKRERIQHNQKRTTLELVYLKERVEIMNSIRMKSETTVSVHYERNEKREREWWEWCMSGDQRRHDITWHCTGSGGPADRSRLQSFGKPSSAQLSSARSLVFSGLKYCSSSYSSA